jgi:hypothetical protein
MAEQLSGVDMLLAQIEDIAGDVRDEIARREAGPEVSPASVTNAVFVKTGYKLRDSAAVRLAEQARQADITATADFEALIDPSGDAAAAFAEGFAADHRRRPTTPELLDGLLTQAATPVGEETEAAEDRVRLNAQLAEDVPAHELDEFDPDADLVLSEDDDEDGVPPE